MVLTFFKNTLILTLFICFSCGSGNKPPTAEASEGIETEVGSEMSEDEKLEVEIEALEAIVVGANQISEYIDLLKDRNVGVVANQTSRIYDPPKEEITKYSSEIFRDAHLVDYLFENNVSIKKVFAPEHGFRGTADAGEVVKDGVDTKTGLPIISLYGKNKKPSEAQLKDIDIMVFDIQDVGARFYTYISSLHYVMEACAEANIPLLILDRPNPNGHYIDGPILEKEYKSFVGMHSVPVVHGMTIGEYTQMINGEGWLESGVKCDITVVKMLNYNHQMSYSLPINPSPNLPNDISINLYPSLCFFEGTFISAGRGTDKQFQIFGAPSLPLERYSFQFTPQTNKGAKYPKFKDEVCFGKDLRSVPKLDKLNLEWLIEAYVSNGKKKDFFNKFFTKLAGTKKLQGQIEQGYTYREIRKTWLQGLADYDKMRQAYLLYE